MRNLGQGPCRGHVPVAVNQQVRPAMFGFQQGLSCVPGWPVAVVVCAQVMSLSLGVWGMKVQPGRHTAGTWCAVDLEIVPSKFQLRALTKQEVGSMDSGSWSWYLAR